MKRVFEKLYIIEEGDKNQMDRKVDETPDTLIGHAHAYHTYVR